MNCPKTKAVFFDFDGTLFFGTAELNRYSFPRALKQMGLKEVTEEMLHATVGMTPPQICKLLLGSDSPEVLKCFGDALYSLIPEYVKEHVFPSEALTDMLKAVHENAYTSILSNASPLYLDAMFNALQIRPFFDEVWHYRPGYTKATAIPELMKQFNVKEAVMVGDRREDVMSGKENGIHTVAMYSAVFEEETKNADFIVHDHAEMKDTLLKIINN